MRTPHHGATAQALVGGGSNPRPGKVSLAHHGILFPDELPEFHRYVLEMLRQPLEGGDVTVARVNGSVKFPAKLSGPLLDRIDVRVEVPALPWATGTRVPKKRGVPLTRARLIHTNPNSGWPG